ncbi:orexin receptor type 2-like [Stylophora pistillata]|uniref:orexin receptor type 2-like n=1 Tax=Stylophora pistillata TaxID=50429 RepID=UPI000C041D9D|nr:orexin receptor type 2-like [Stylophora pistillata]XP_022784261.1 orexin receptor type 2-like [Stylophora pistillata]XP_022784262.1 orexin receptor type 2-like [Stylophora pistillata]
MELGFTLAYAVTMIVAMQGNILLIYIVWKKRETRTLTSFLFVNMAVADLLVTVFHMPVSMAHFYVTGFTGTFGNIFCRLLFYLEDVCTAASIFSLIVMAFDRYFAVVYPLKRMIWFRRAKHILPVIWIASWTFMAVTPFSYMANDSNGKCSYTNEHIPRVAFWTYLLVINYILPLTIICFLYITIARKIWFHEIPGQVETSRVQPDGQIPTKKVLRTLIIVVVVFAVCWLPLQVFRMDFAATGKVSWQPVAIYFISWLGQANSAINPWLYISLNGKMNSAFKRMIRCHGQSNTLSFRSSTTTMRSNTAVSTV